MAGEKKKNNRIYAAVLLCLFLTMIVFNIVSLAANKTIYFTSEYTDSSGATQTGSFTATESTEDGYSQVTISGPNGTSYIFNSLEGAGIPSTVADGSTINLDDYSTFKSNAQQALTGSVTAGQDSGYSDDTNGPLQWAITIQQGILDSVVSIATGNESSAKADPLAKLYKLVCGTDNDGAGEIGGLGWYKDGSKAMIAVAALWAIAIAMAHFLNSAERGGDPVENVFKVLVEITIALLLMMYINKIMTVLYQLGEWVIGLLASDSASDKQETVGKAKELIKNLTGKDAEKLNIFDKFGAYVQLFIPYVLTQLIMIAAKFVVLQTLFEIGIRRFFAPLAVADIYQDGMRSAGVRYFKKYFATFLKLAIIIFVAEVGGQMTTSVMGSVTTNGMERVMITITINFTLVGVMMRGGEFANDIVGV